MTQNTKKKAATRIQYKRQSSGSLGLTWGCEPSTPAEVYLAITFTVVTLALWRCHRAFFAPASQKPGFDAIRRESESSFPLSDSQCLPLERDTSIGARVVRLLKRICPTHVAGFVSAIAVNTINRVSLRWRWPDVAQEYFKRIAPRLAHDYAAATVHVIVRGFRIVAALFCGAPRVILAGVARSVFSPSLADQFVFQTSAAFRMANRQFVADDINIAPAFAAAVPDSVADVRFVRRAPFDCQSREHQACQYSDMRSLRHMPILSVIAMTGLAWLR